MTPDDSRPLSSNDGITRRAALKKGVMVGGALLVGVGNGRSQDAVSMETGHRTLPARTIALEFSLNGRPAAASIEARTTLLDMLREQLAHPGTKKGCDHGQCGACTVHVGGRRVLSCLILAASVQGKSVTTIEGLANGENLHPLQAAFIEHDAFQCGFCTPGQLMSAAAMLKEPWPDSPQATREAMSGNLCRCGAYCGIIAAITQCRNKSGI
jgi:xanthine dehydrogenase YagT iron-sulfur-binding subunit